MLCCMCNLACPMASLLSTTLSLMFLLRFIKKKIPQWIKKLHKLCIPVSSHYSGRLPLWVNSSISKVGGAQRMVGIHWRCWHFLTKKFFIHFVFLCQSFCRDKIYIIDLLFMPLFDFGLSWWILKYPQMADVEMVKKMLRAVLQANKGGVSLSRLQLEYKELTGEQIPHKQMGYSHLDAMLANMPSLVRTERNRSGEVCVWAGGACPAVCFAGGGSLSFSLMSDCATAPVSPFPQMLCFASGANEVAHVAKVVARQRSSKKTGRPHLVNTHMRVKPAAQLVLNGRVFAHVAQIENNLWFSSSYQSCLHL